MKINYLGININKEYIFKNLLLAKNQKLNEQSF